MVTRRAPGLLLALLLAGCPDDVGRGFHQVTVTGLASPTGLAGIPNGGSQILLTWADHATVETGYRLEMNFGPFGTPFVADLKFLPANAASHVYPSIPNATYYFRVVAITATMESDPSNVVVVTTPDVPVQPAGLTATTVSSSQISLAWLDVANETGYTLQRSLDGGLSWNTVTTLAANSTTCVDTGLSADTDYGYRIIAWNLIGNSTPSDPAFAPTATDKVGFFVPYLGQNYGRFPSVALAADDSDHISHYDVKFSDVLYSTRTPTTSFITTTVDAGPTGTQDVGGDGTSITVDGAGKVHIVAHDVTDDTLRYVTNSPGSWIATPVDIGGAKPRIVCDPLTGALHAVYQDRPVSGVSRLRYAQKPPGQPWITADLISIPVNPTALHSLALDGSGVAHVFLVTANGWLYHIVRAPSGLGGTTGQQVLFPASHGIPDFTSLAIDASGTVHAICHGPASMSLYHLSQAFGSGGWEFETVHSAAGQDLGSYCSVAIHPVTGRFHVAYYDATHKDLRYARKDPGGIWVLRVIDAFGDVGSHASLAIGASGVVHIAYRDETGGRLRIAVGTP